MLRPWFEMLSLSAAMLKTLCFWASALEALTHGIQKVQGPCPANRLFTAADGCAIGHQIWLTHRLQNLQGMLPTPKLLTGTDDRIVADEILRGGSNPCILWLKLIILGQVRGKCGQPRWFCTIVTQSGVNCYGLRWVNIPNCLTGELQDCNNPLRYPTSFLLPCHVWRWKKS